MFFFTIWLVVSSEKYEFVSWDYKVPVVPHKAVAEVSKIGNL